MDSKTFNSKKYGKLTVNHQRKSTSRWFHTETIISREEASIIQQQVGYHPHGYSFYDFKSNINGTSWKCFLSCD